ncbi:hypothetical protein [Proteiniborus sp.]|uniref:hypothetical protein n=1 Tax=Proteiniborus sp. TaxID=2079015 RepID=UPI00331C0B32
MTIKFLKRLMLLPKEEHIINKRVSIRGLEVQLLSYTIEEDENRLWIMYEDKDLLDVDPDDEYWREFRTNREELLRKIEANKINKYFHIKQMEIQGQTVSFDSSTYGPLHDLNKKELMQLQHFTEKGLIPSELEEAPLRSLVMGSYVQVRDEDTPIIDATKDLSLKLHIGRDSKEILIQCPITVKFGKQEIETKVKYYDSSLGQEQYFYIDEIYSFDPYEDIIQKTERIEDDKMREDILKHHIEALESICPRNKNLAVIKYETTDNVQLNFMMKDYLDSEPIRHNSATSIGFISSTKEVGINGNKVRECVLQTIDKDFNGNLEIELFSRYVEIPEQIIQCYYL